MLLKSSLIRLYFILHLVEPSVTIRAGANIYATSMPEIVCDLVVEAKRTQHKGKPDLKFWNFHIDDQAILTTRNVLFCAEELVRFIRAILHTCPVKIFRSLHKFKILLDIDNVYLMEPMIGNPITNNGILRNLVVPQLSKTRLNNILQDFRISRN